MEEKGVVLSQKGNVAEIAVVRVSACGSGCSSCGGGCSKSEVVVNALTEEQLYPGDIVALGASSSSLILSAAVAYLIPLTMLVIGAVGGSVLLKNYGVKSYELGGFGIGILFVAVSFFLVRVLGNKVAERKMRFEIVRIEKRANK